MNTSTLRRAIWSPRAVGVLVALLLITAFVDGWDPVRLRLTPAQLPYAPRTLLAFVAQGVLLLAVATAAHRWLGRHASLPGGLGAFSALAAVAGASYLAFWCYFASPVLGHLFSWAVMVGAGVMLIRAKPAAAPEAQKGELALPLGLATLIGVGFIALTCLYDNAPLSRLAAHRFLVRLPVDNEIPRIFADRLWAGQSPRPLLGDWLSSDRPPLETGWELLTRPFCTLWGFDVDTAATTAAVWFQLLWVPAAWALLRRLGARCREASAMIAAMAFTGFFLFYSVYTWPKLGAAALVVGAFVLWQPEAGEPASRCRFAAGGVCAALGWLAHGGVAFSLVGLIPLVLWSLRRDRRSRGPWLAALVAFAVVAASWSAYQQFYEPPGNRLLKWHLAGVIPIDSRGFVETLADSYRQLGWRGALANRWNNLLLQGAGNWSNLGRFRPAADPLLRRGEEVTFTGRIFVWWLLAAPFLAGALWRQRRRADRFLGRAAIWWFCGWLAWLALMFLPDSARCHQGTLVTQLLGFALLTWAACSLHRLLFLALAGLQIAAFFATWILPSPEMTGPVNPLAAAIAILAAVALGGTLAGGMLAASRPAPAATM